MKLALVSPYDFAYPGGVTEHVLQAGAVLASLPESFRRAARQPGQAAALFVALGIDAAPDARERTATCETLSTEGPL